jgi:hypothetical protein
MEHTLACPKRPEWSEAIRVLDEQAILSVICHAYLGQMAMRKKCKVEQ